MWPQNYMTLENIYILYIANRSRWKSFSDGQASSNSLENFRGLPIPLKISLAWPDPSFAQGVND